MLSVAEFLKDNGIQPSIQRVMIAKYLREYKDHPSAEDIYNRLHETVPTLSKATVYNTLNLFYSKNIVNMIVTEDGERHFDGFTNPHAHVICPHCCKIEDLELGTDERSALENILNRTKAEGTTLILRKCCKDCASKEN